MKARVIPISQVAIDLPKNPAADVRVIDLPEERLREAVERIGELFRASTHELKGA